jgi:hypothetical protein
LDVIIQFLNANSGAIQAIATAVLVLITGWYTFLTWRVASAANKQADAARAQTGLLAEQLAHQQRALQEQIAANTEALHSETHSKVYAEDFEIIKIYRGQASPQTLLLREWRGSAGQS